MACATRSTRTRSRSSGYRKFAFNWGALGRMVARSKLHEGMMKQPGNMFEERTSTVSRYTNGGQRRPIRYLAFMLPLLLSLAACSAQGLATGAQQLATALSATASPAPTAAPAVTINPAPTAAPAATASP